MTISERIEKEWTAWNRPGNPAGCSFEVRNGRKVRVISVYGSNRHDVWIRYPSGRVALRVDDRKSDVDELLKGFEIQ